MSLEAYCHVGQTELFLLTFLLALLLSALLLVLSSSSKPSSLFSSACSRRSHTHTHTHTHTTADSHFFQKSLESLLNRPKFLNYCCNLLSAAIILREGKQIWRQKWKLAPIKWIPMKPATLSQHLVAINETASQGTAALLKPIHSLYSVVIFQSTCDGPWSFLLSVGSGAPSWTSISSWPGPSRHTHTKYMLLCFAVIDEIQGMTSKDNHPFNCCQ